MRIEHGGRVLAYSADTAPCDALIRLAQDADLFLCEASYLDGEDNPPDLHLTGREAGEAATKAGVGRLVLTHLVTAWGSEANGVRGRGGGLRRAGRGRPRRAPGYDDLTAPSACPGTSSLVRHEVCRHDSRPLPSARLAA